LRPPAQQGQFTDRQTIARRQRLDRLGDLFALPRAARGELSLDEPSDH
jgi:hypothetical protein